MLPVLAPLLATLAQSGLSMIGDAVLAKGKDVIEQKLGVSLEASVKSEEGLVKLRQLAMEHEEFLLESVIKQREQELEFQKVQEQEISGRWKADMLSDSWMSKNIRPSALVYLTVVISLFAFGSAFSFNVADTYIVIFKELLLLVYAAYFGGRSIEKIVSMRSGGSK